MSVNSASLANILLKHTDRAGLTTFGPGHQKTCLRGLQTAQAQTSLRIRAV